MKIGIIVVTGEAGSANCAEDFKRGHEVTAMVPEPDRAARLLGPKLTVLAGEAFALTVDDLSGFEVVIEAFATAPAHAYVHLDLAAWPGSVFSGRPRLPGPWSSSVPGAWP